MVGNKMCADNLFDMKNRFYRDPKMQKLLDIKGI